MTNQLLRQTLHKSEASCKLVKYAIELSKFDISYKPRVSIKAQVMADFVAEFTEPKVDPNYTNTATSSNERQVW